MRASRHGLLFWVLLLVAVILPSGLSATKKLYQAGISGSDGAGKGNAMIFANTVGDGYDYMVRTFSLPTQQVQSVYLTPVARDWTIPLCTNGGAPEDDCVYQGDGNLDIEGTVNSSSLRLANVRGSVFKTTLEGGNLTIQLVDGSGGVLGSGTFVRTM